MDEEDVWGDAAGQRATRGASSFQDGSHGEQRSGSSNTAQHGFSLGNDEDDDDDSNNAGMLGSGQYPTRT